MIALSIVSFLAECGLLDLSTVPKSTPSAKCLRNIIFEAACDSVLLERKSMQELPLTIMADKGDGRGCRDGANFPKLVAKFSHSTDGVDVTCIGISSAVGDSKSAAKNISHALKIYDSEDKKVTISNQGTDAGRGGTGSELANQMDKQGRVRNMNEYNWTTCALHALNLTLSSPTELTLGPGGLGKRTALQLLDTACDLSENFKDTEWSSLWKLLTGVSCDQLKAPVLSRWECIADACEHIVKNHSRWVKVATHIIHQEKSDSAIYTIASHLY